MAKKIATEERNPALSALLNFIIWGTGYLYNGRRVVLGVGLILAVIIMHAPVFYLGIGWYFKLPGLLVVFSHIIMSLAFAYDGYIDCRK